MPLHPNFVERQLIKWGMIPGPLVDAAFPGFLMSAMIGAGKVACFTRSVASLIGWNLFLFPNGRAYEVNDVLRWLRDAGFPHAKVIPLKQSPRFTLLVASR